MRARNWVSLAPSNKMTSVFVPPRSMPTRQRLFMPLSPCFVIFGMVTGFCAKRKKSDTLSIFSCELIVNKYGSFFNTDRQGLFHENCYSLFFPHFAAYSDPVCTAQRANRRWQTS